jgi:hypothetical protein
MRATKSGLRCVPSAKLFRFCVVKNTRLIRILLCVVCPVAAPSMVKFAQVNRILSMKGVPHRPNKNVADDQTGGQASPPNSLFKVGEFFGIL